MVPVAVWLGTEDSVSERMSRPPTKKLPCFAMISGPGPSEAAFWEAAFWAAAESGRARTSNAARRTGTHRRRRPIPARSCDDKFDDKFDMGPHRVDRRSSLRIDQASLDAPYKNIFRPDYSTLGCGRCALHTIARIVRRDGVGSARRIGIRVSLPAVTAAAIAAARRAGPCLGGPALASPRGDRPHRRSASRSRRRLA